MAYQPLYQAPPKWQVWLAARWRAWCAWWMYRPAAEVADLRWYAAEDSNEESSEGQQQELVGRHRTPEEQQPVDPWHDEQEQPAEQQPLREQQRNEHAGATADWSPTNELRQIMAGELTPLDSLPSFVIAAELRVPDTEALEADTHAALEGWDELLAPHWARIDAVVAAAEQRQYPLLYIAERAREATQLIPIVTSELVAA